jgi:hypothetical protein
MRIIQNLGFVGLLLMCMGTRMAAQETHKGWVAGAALPVATPELKQWTNQSFMGICLDGAYQIPIAESRNCFRVGLGVNYLPGKEQELLDMMRTLSLTNIQLNLDVLFPLGSTPLLFITGLSLNTWLKDVSAGEESVSGTVKYAFGKYGLRLGAEYALNHRFSVALTFQLVELGVDEGEFTIEGQKGWPNWGVHSVTPSWVQVGVRYRF